MSSARSVSPLLLRDTGVSPIFDRMGHGVHIHFIEPGKPYQHAYVDRVSKRFRTEVLDAWIFASLDEVRDVREQWRHASNTERSHESLGRVPHSPSSRDQPPPPHRLISNGALDGEAYVGSGEKLGFERRGDHTPVGVFD